MQLAAIIVQIALVFPARCSLSAACFLSPYALWLVFYLAWPDPDCKLVIFPGTFEFQPKDQDKR
jgi:hypothetical protein